MDDPYRYFAPPAPPFTRGTPPKRHPVSTPQEVVERVWMSRFVACSWTALFQGELALDMLSRPSDRWAGLVRYGLQRALHHLLRVQLHAALDIPSYVDVISQWSTHMQVTYTDIAVTYRAHREWWDLDTASKLQVYTATEQQERVRALKAYDMLHDIALRICGDWVQETE